MLPRAPVGHGVPHVSVPVGRAGNDPIRFWRPVDAGHAQVVLIQRALMGHSRGARQRVDLHVARVMKRKSNSTLIPHTHRQPRISYGTALFMLFYPTFYSTDLHLLVVLGDGHSLTLGIECVAIDGCHIAGEGEDALVGSHLAEARGLWSVYAGKEDVPETEDERENDSDNRQLVQK